MNVGGRTGWAAVTAAAVAVFLGVTACGPTGSGRYGGGRAGKAKTMSASADRTALIGARPLATGTGRGT
ncbi:hypothetical protein [Streptomyces sp. NPDC058457]|uniref:hypothetical protein n=1 Tax=Streptomyces sp. NPDC058457 TaxID=3346507 RepID=UPI00365B719D